jgi:uncharacterized OsmC-like protein
MLASGSAIESHSRFARKLEETMSDTIRNGVNVTQLQAAVDAVKSDPRNGQLSFTVHSRWKGGTRTEHTTGPYRVGGNDGQRQKEHSITTDEPHEVLGGDRGISPAETLLSSLAACLSVGYAASAAALGIDLDELTLRVSGDGSLEGFMGLRNQRPGLSGVKVEAHVKSSAPAAKLRELHDHVTSHSPILDTIANPVRVESKLVTA